MFKIKAIRRVQENLIFKASKICKVSKARIFLNFETVQYFRLLECPTQWDLAYFLFFGDSL